MTILLEVARAALAEGLSVIPTNPGGGKRPYGKWKDYQQTPPTRAEIERWFDPTRPVADGLGFICGAVSGGLELLEFEGRAVGDGTYDQFLAAADSAGLTPLVDRIADGYDELTPSGGRHWLYRCAEVSGNVRLASIPGDPGPEVLIETRGEGGFVVVAPSGGRTHETGGTWVLEAGGAATIVTITPQERAQLHALAHTFDRTPEVAAASTSRPTRSTGDALRPGTDYNARTTWAEVLEPHGWTFVRQAGPIGEWRRPDKTDPGISATTNATGNDTLIVHSTSTPFKKVSPSSYDRFGAYAVLEHGGDLTAARLELMRRGYGTPRPRPARVDAVVRDNVVGGITAPDGRSVTLTPAATITPDRMIWTWQDRIPAGGSTLMAGEEGQAKTALAIHLAARLTRGDLPGDRFGRPSDVVYVGCEDDRATVLVPRLIAAGADLSRFHFVDMANGWMFSVGGDCDALRDAMRGLDVAAIIIDPLDSHLGQVDTHRKSEVQASIARLAQLAQEQRCAAIGIAHFNKATAATVRLKVVGSIGFTSAVRAVIAVGPHPEHPDDEKVAVLAKVNGGHLGVPAVRFRVEAVKLPHPEGGEPIVTAGVVILGEEHMDANAIITAGSPEERSALDEACEWLRSVLSDGPVDRAEIVKWARGQGITDRTLDRAARKLDVVSVRDESKSGRPATWSLPGYPPRGIRQTRLADTPQGSDQEKHPSEEGYPPLSRVADTPPDEGVADPLDLDLDVDDPDHGYKFAQARAARIATRPATIGAYPVPGPPFLEPSTEGAHP